jgi:NADH-quinone oxidoreductase subunit M
MSELPLLTLLLLAPLAGLPLIWGVPHYTAARDGALLASLLALLISLLVVASFDPTQTQLQMVDAWPWIPDLNIHFRLGIDGISLLFLPATTLLFAAALIAARPAQTQARLYFSLILLLETTVLGVFMATDALFFFLCWELTVVPIYFLVAMWGVGARRQQAATQYTLLMLAGGVPLLFGLMIPAVSLPHLAFDLPTLLGTPLPRNTQFVVFLLLLVGFGVKAPLPPLHTWLPTFALEGPVGVVALIAGLKLGLYGLMRFAIPLAPEAAASLHWLLAGIGVIAALHGALAALAQTNLRVMLAYAGVSHVGLVLLGLASFTESGVQGALLLTVSLALATGGGFLAASFLQLRVGSCELQNLGGVFVTMPRLAVFFLLCGLAGLGLPGTAGFPGEWLVLLSTLQTHTGAGIAGLAAMVFGGAYFMSLYRKAFFGPAYRPAVVTADDLLPREAWAAVLIGGAILVFGLWPQPLIELTQGTVRAWLAAVQG